MKHTTNSLNNRIEEINTSLKNLDNSLQTANFHNTNKIITLSNKLLKERAVLKDLLKKLYIEEYTGSEIEELETKIQNMEKIEPKNNMHKELLDQSIARMEKEILELLS